jgi:hypothetical protein
MHQTRRKLASLLLLGPLVLGAAACGGDDDDDVAASGDDTEETTTTEAGEAEPTGICADLPPSEETAEGATITTVIAEDYEYFAAEALELGGKQTVTLINKGTELHELAIVKVDPSETRTLDELIASEEQPDTVTPVGFGVACPETSVKFNVDLTAPGRYIAICNIPVGTTPDSDPEAEPSGPPHSSKGMAHEFTIA